MESQYELDYEQKVNYKWKIFETLCRDMDLNRCDDAVIDKILERVDHIYEELTKQITMTFKMWKTKEELNEWQLMELRMGRLMISKTINNIKYYKV